MSCRATTPQLACISNMFFGCLNPCTHNHRDVEYIKRPWLSQVQGGNYKKRRSTDLYGWRSDRKNEERKQKKTKRWIRFFGLQSKPSMWAKKENEEQILHNSPFYFCFLSLFFLSLYLPISISLHFLFWYLVLIEDFTGGKQHFIALKRR